MGLSVLQYPFTMGGILSLGPARVLEIVEELGVSLKGVPKFPGAVVGAILKHVNSPSELKPCLTPADLDVIGKKLGVGLRSAWKNKKTSFDQAVLARLFEERPEYAKQPPRPTSRDVSHAPDWAELASLKTWKKLDVAKRRKFAQSLARALGERFSFVDFVGEFDLARFQDATLKLAFVAIPGGRFSMGLNDSEKKALQSLARIMDEEAKMFVRDISETARPAHVVTLPPFLCAQAPVTKSQGAKFVKGAQILDGHNVCMFDADKALALAEKTASRLLSEAEWEYVARSGGVRAWLSGDQEMASYAENTLANDLSDDEHPFGIHGLGWGSWVEDGWHLAYGRAPADGSAWEPLQMPEVARGGALLSYPWQVDGESFMLHAAFRERLRGRPFPLILARDLPALRKK